MGCEGQVGCSLRESFVVQLLTLEGPVTRRSCDDHLPAAVTWAHEVAGLRLAVDPYAAHWLVAVTPIPDDDAEIAEAFVEDPDLSRDLRPIYMADLASARPPGRSEPGLVAWTQRAFYRPGYHAPTRGRALAGLIFWPLAIAVCVYAAVAFKVPVAVTRTAISHAVHNRFYPAARDELLIRALGTVVILLSAFMLWVAANGYWRTRPAADPAATYDAPVEEISAR